jgi:hypothetical protein
MKCNLEGRLNTKKFVANTYVGDSINSVIKMYDMKNLNHTLYRYFTVYIFT